MKKTIYIFVLILLMAGGLSAINMSEVRAFPVPFNPSVDSGLKFFIPESGDSGNDPFTVSITVYDVNGDRVIEKTFASKGYTGNVLDSYVVWNGRTSQGTIVDAGFYVVKVVIQDEKNGNYGKKILRVLVKR